MASKNIAFIGGGNMALSIIGGLITSGWSNNHIYVSDPSFEQRKNLQSRFNINCFENNEDCIMEADTVIFATKPQMLKQAAQSVGQQLAEQRPLIISIAAGVISSDILRWLGIELPLVRVMPNTPALINRGVSGFYSNDLCTESQRTLAETIMQAVGKVVWVDSEKDIDTVTGISGSGPAYFFKLMEIMVDSAVNHGLDQRSARTLVLETAAGAAEFANRSEFSLSELRKQVTSPSGTTHAAISTMESLGIDSTISEGIITAIDRSKELSKTLGNE